MTDGNDEIEPQDGPIDEPVTQGGQNLRDVLTEIRAKRGALTPVIVEEEARDVMHPLHHRFEWDDSIAGYRYRLLQAAQLLRVRYRQDAGDDRADLRAFWVVRDAEGKPTSVYEPMEEVIMDDFQRDLMLRQLRRDWQTFKRRYAHMSEFVTEVLAGLDEDQAG